jgi:tetratricopeptide (TPR) repeat protein
VAQTGLPLDTFDEIARQASSLESEGHWEAAADLYADAYGRGIHNANMQQVTYALRMLAGARWQEGRHEEAEELAWLGWFVAEQNGYRDSAARAINVVASILYSQHQLLTANYTYQQARELALDVGDDDLVGFTCQNMGVIHNILGDLREARALYLESVGATARSGDRKTAMMAYNNLAMVCADLHDWMEAEVYFGRGIEIAHQLSHVPMLAKLHANRAEPLIHTGDLAQASIALDIADRLTIHTTDMVTLADISRYRAMIARIQGDFVSAEQHVSLSLTLAVSSKLDLEHAEALEERACLLSAEGQTDKAVATLSEAHERYEALGAKRDAARTLEVLENWSCRTSTAASTLPEVVP